MRKLLKMRKILPTRKIAMTVKLSETERHLFEEAAHKRSMTLSDFIRDAASELAARTVETCGSCGRPHLNAKVA